MVSKKYGKGAIFQCSLPKETFLSFSKWITALLQKDKFEAKITDLF